MDLNLVKLVYSLKTNNADAEEGFIYKALRRFDVFFRRSFCRFAFDSCKACKVETACPYRDVFSQTLSTDPDVVRRHQKPPLPFSFKINRMDIDSSSLELAIVMVGNAINYLSIFHSAIFQLIDSISDKCVDSVPVITGIYSLDYQSGRHEIDFATPDNLNLIVLSSREVMENTVVTESIRLVLTSPLRLLSAKSLLHGFDFNVFMRSQLRRCSSLFAYYGDGELDIDYAGLSSASDRVICSKNSIRYSQPSWSQSSGNAGLLGTSEFRCLTPGMLPVLTLGSYFNSGKGAASGMGAYRIEVA